MENITQQSTVEHRQHKTHDISHVNSKTKRQSKRGSLNSFSKAEKNENKEKWSKLSIKHIPMIDTLFWLTLKCNRDYFESACMLLSWQMILLRAKTVEENKAITKVKLTKHDHMNWGSPREAMDSLEKPGHVQPHQLMLLLQNPKNLRR